MPVLHASHKGSSCPANSCARVPIISLFTFAFVRFSPPAAHHLSLFHIAMAGQMGGAGLGGGDPRMSISQDEKFGQLGGEGITSYSRPQLLGIRDPSVTFEQ